MMITKNLKQQYYAELTPTINTTKYLNIIHCATKGSIFSFSSLISWGAKLKNRKNKVTHTSVIYENEGYHPRTGEADPILGSYTHCSLWDTYFKGDFKGKLYLEELKLARPLAPTEHKILCQFIEYIQNGKPYSVKLAIGSYIDKFIKSEQDLNVKVYCTDAVLDYADQLLKLIYNDKSYKLFPNNAEKTPAELYDDNLYKIPQFKDSRRRLIFDHTKTWSEMSQVLKSDKNLYNL